VDIGGKPQIVLRPAILSLGLNYTAQRRKLKGRSWACVSETTTQLPGDSQRRDHGQMLRRPAHYEYNPGIFVAVRAAAHWGHDPNRERRFWGWSTRRESGCQRLNRPPEPDGGNGPLSDYPKALGSWHI
jgi:hypothetical protein